MTEGRARHSFDLKVKALEQAVLDGEVPPNIPILNKLDDLRAWCEPANKEICEWKSFSVAAPGGPNADIRGRFDRIFPAFAQLQTGKRKRGPKPSKNKPVLEWFIEAERDALLAQNAQLLITQARLKDDNRVQSQLIDSLRKINAELIEKLSKITSLRPVR